MQNSVTALRQDEEQLSVSHEIPHVLLINIHVFLAFRANHCSRNPPCDMKQHQQAAGTSELFEIVDEASNTWACWSADERHLENNF